METAFELLKRLGDHGVDFVIVGGVAGAFHGSSLVTEDLDICAPLTADNIARIAIAFRGLRPRHRMNPIHPPLVEDVDQLRCFKNLYLLTDLGQVDVLGDLDGIGSYADVLKRTVPGIIEGVECKFLELDALVTAKKTVNREKDRRALPILERLLRDRTRTRPPTG